ncbi:MAG: sec-independent protein translocase protein TatA [Lentimonas sp.]|jgi:sec-independent protein translocase protein TatA
MSTVAFIQNLGGSEIILIAAIILLFFGAKRLPDLVGSLGKSMREFKQATSGIEEDRRPAMDVEVQPMQKAPTRT